MAKINLDPPLPDTLEERLQMRVNYLQDSFWAIRMELQTILRMIDAGQLPIELALSQLKEVADECKLYEDVTSPLPQLFK